MGISDANPPASQLPLLELANGFLSFKTLSAATDLELFTKLADGRAMTEQEVAAELNLQARPARLLLAACASLGLLDKSGDRYQNSALSEEYLVIGRPNYFGGLVRFADREMYPSWHHVIDALRTNSPVSKKSNGAATWSPEAQDDLFKATFWEGMHSMAGATAGALAEVYDFSQHRRLLDVGGGSGGFPIRLCQRTPGLTAAVYELPHVCSIVAEKVKAAGLQDRIEALPGNFEEAPALPAGYDVVLLSQVLHDHDEATNRRLLGKVFAALPPGGVALVCEQLLNDDRTGPRAAALMGMTMLVAMVAGENYTGSEYSSWLREAGFTDVHVVPFVSAGANGVVVARKPISV
jgi:SAM-dependent methyltransferase